MSLANMLPAFAILAVVLVIIMTELIKKLDKKNFLKGRRVWVPALLSGAIAALMGYGKFYDTHQIWFWWAVIFALSVFGYEAILKKIHEWIGTKSDSDEKSAA